MRISKDFIIAYKYFFKHYISLSIKYFNFISYNIFITLISILVIIIFIPILTSFSFCSLLNMFKSKGIFIGIQEIASNIKTIQMALDANSITTNSLIIPHVFKYGNNFKSLKTNNSTLKYTYYYDINVNYLSKDHIYTNIKALITLPILFIKYFVNNDTWFFIWNKTFLPYNLDLFFLKFSKKS